MRFFVHCSVLLVATVIIAGCSSAESKQPTSSSWERPDTDEEYLDFELLDIEPVPAEYVLQVSANKMPEAIKILDRTSMITLKETEAIDFLERAIEIPSGHKAYLVRGLANDAPASGFICLFHKGKLWVAYSYMGNWSPHPIKQPLIIFLKARPTKVFVTFMRSE